MMARSPSSSHPLLCVILLLALAQSVVAKPYSYLNYSTIHYRLKELADEHPKLIRLYSAQDRFSLPHVGNCSEKATESADPEPAPCSIWIVELTNYDTVASDPQRPEVLVSGELHGNEVVGPHVVLAYLEYMVSNYETHPFAKRMIDTRVVTLVPMTNAVGFHRAERFETQDGTPFDPNRDFGFDQQPAKCMQTVAARALNELFRVHLFRILVTFHGGTNVIGYEWGDTSHCNGNVCNPAPDAAIMRALAERMSVNAAPAGTYEAAYPIGDMGSTVYSVNGGLEDWAYGASWAKEGTSCKPTTLGGYAVERTRIERVTKRCVTYLVETSRDKKPMEHHLGADDAILHPGAENDGHVPRNVRLLFSVVDAAEPYVALDDKVEATNQVHPTIAWSLGGAFIVDGTVVQWSTINGTDNGRSDVLNGTAGVTIAGGKGMQFRQVLPISFSSTSPSVYFRIAAVVDRSFVKQPEKSVPDVSPQSHLMGTRASTQWNFSVKGKKLTGREVFFSRTQKLEMSQAGHLSYHEVHIGWDVNEGSGKLVSESENELLRAILAHSGGFESGSITDMTQSSAGRKTIARSLVGVSAIVAIAVIILVCVNRRRQARKRAPSFTLGEEEDDEESRVLTASTTGENEESEVVSASAFEGHAVSSHV